LLHSELTSQTAIDDYFRQAGGKKQKIFSGYLSGGLQNDSGEPRRKP
jgi:hypothetical protein